MAKKSNESSPMAELRKLLSNQGYALHLATERKGDVLTARVEIVDVKAERTFLKLIASGRLEDVDFTVGLDVAEEPFWDVVLKLVNLLDSVKNLVPIRMTTSR
ncbi:MAG: hypothetical protein ACE5HJ_02450 [Thermoplasmata archaeon]